MITDDHLEDVEIVVRLRAELDQQNNEREQNEWARLGSEPGKEMCMEPLSKGTLREG